MSIFGKRNRNPVMISRDAPSSVYLVHFVEHDRVIACNAPHIHAAIAFAQRHAHVIEPNNSQSSRPMMFDNDRICIMMYGRDQEYTCNIMHAPVFNHTDRVDITLAA